VIAVEMTRRGPVFRVRARPGASSRRAGGEHNGALEVRTTAPPDKGKANSDILRILARALGVRPSGLVLVSGETGREKKVLAVDMDLEDLEKKLNALTGGEN